MLVASMHCKANQWWVDNLSIGQALKGDTGLFLKDRKICFLLLFYVRTVLFG